MNLSSFESVMSNCYFRSLQTIYDPVDPKTLKAICLQGNFYVALLFRSPNSVVFSYYFLATTGQQQLASCCCGLPCTSLLPIRIPCTAAALLFYTSINIRAIYTREISRGLFLV